MQGVQAYEPKPFQELENSPEAEEMTGQGESLRSYRPLTIQYSDPAQTMIAGCRLTLRTYNGKLVGPTLRVKPGQTLKFTVENDLPRSSRPELDMTNLHTHGLQVDPEGKRVGDKFIASDNVLISYGPGQHQDYEITVPQDHPSGTFWYHAHHHMSTAVQVSSGMAGALIVEDDKNKLPQPLKNIKEKILIFQSILYNPQGQLADLDLNRVDQTAAGGNPNWKNSNRRITINGQLVPRITMRPGEIQRWRMIGATVRIPAFQLRLARHNLNEIAVDGLYLPHVDTWTENKGVDLLPGYRSDVLVQASMTPGTYMMVSDPVGQGKISGLRPTTLESLSQSVVAAVVVEGDPVNSAQLPTPDEMKSIAYGWKDGKETKLDEEWSKENPDPNPKKQHIQQLTFNKDTNALSNTREDLAVDGRVFNVDVPPRRLTAGRLDKWVVRAIAAGSHVFHIHVNPFQVCRMAPDGTTKETVWKDTVVVAMAQGQPPVGGCPQPVELFTQYREDVTGKFVTHCHFLDHEDNGMMQLVEVVKGETP
jgi:FtsP/CotA-like multicopper oxidase with cupredoxin domain